VLHFSEKRRITLQVILAFLIKSLENSSNLEILAGTVCHEYHESCWYGYGIFDLEEVSAFDLVTVLGKSELLDVS